MAKSVLSRLSLAGATFFILLRASTQILANVLCVERHIFAAVTEDSINMKYHTKKLSNGEWFLDTTVTWAKPAESRFGPSGFNGYALMMTPIADMSSSQPFNCSNYAITTHLSYVFSNLNWGEKYQFEIRTANLKKTGHHISAMRGNIVFTTPDCYEETKDIEYCLQEDISTLSKVRDVQLECLVRDPLDSSSITAFISWLPPLQVNGNLNEVEIKYWEARHDVEYDTLKNEVHKRDVTEDERSGWPHSRYESPISDLKDLQDYILEIKMFIGNLSTALVSSEEVVYHFNTYNLTNETVPLILNGTLVSGCYPTTYDDNGTSEVQRSVTEKRIFSDEATLAVLILLSLLAVLTVVALILCYLRKRPVTHLSKQGIFGRFPGEAGGLQKSPEAEALRQKGTFDGERDSGRGDVWQTVQSSLGVNIFYEPNVPPSLSENDPIFLTKEFNRSFLRIEDKLGSGQFGVVYKGYALGIDGTDKYIPVAVKSLKVDSTDAMKLDFLSEIKLIIEIGSHPNILPIYGCCTCDEPFYLITEFMKYGDLLRFLLQCKEEIYQEQDPIYKVTKRGQLQIARQIARGMEYLSSTRYYHGDLAARNVLVGEDLVVKISDFGMADDIYQQGYKRLGPERKRPVKWVSLETNARGQCTIQSDVWSFGIVLYEIYTFGDVPYPGLDGRDVVRTLMEGFRMDKPDNCSNEIYEIMLQCWHENPYDRPSFTELYTRLDDMLSQSSDYICDLEVNVRYHPDTSQSFRPSSLPVPIGVLPSNVPNNGFEMDECIC